MRIAMAVDPNIPVPPRYYGGIERIVDTLGRGLTAEGHEVTLFPIEPRKGPSGWSHILRWRRRAALCGAIYS